MTTSRLPINVIRTKDVEQFYEQALEKNQLGVSDFVCYIDKEKQNFSKGSSKSYRWSTSRSTSTSWAYC